MTTSTAHPTSDRPEGRLPLRLDLDLDHSSTGDLDGAWWPQSRDLALEAVDLVDHFPADIGRIQRLLVSPPDWEVAAGTPALRRIRAARGTVKVGSFPRDDTHLVILTLAPGERLHLLVIPYDTDPARAAGLMTRTPGSLGPGGAKALLGLA